MDDSAHAFVAEAYYMKCTPEVKLASLLVTTILSSEEELGFWTSMMPSAAERCRTWTHSSLCEQAKDDMSGMFLRDEILNTKFEVVGKI